MRHGGTASREVTLTLMSEEATGDDTNPFGAELLSVAVFSDMRFFHDHVGKILG